MGIIRNALLAAGLGLLLHSPVKAQEESIWDKIKTTLSEEKTKAKEELENFRQQTRKILDLTKDKSSEDYKELYQKADMEAKVLVTKNIPMIDTETGKIISFDTFARKLASDESLKGSDLEKDPIRTSIGLIYDRDAFSKYKIINADGKWLTQEEAFAYINEQHSNLMKEFRTTKTSSSTRSLEETISRRFTVGEELELVSNNRTGKLEKIPWWNDLNENINFGGKTINISSSSTGATIEGLPEELTISCEGEGNTADYSEFTLTPNRNKIGFDDKMCLLQEDSRYVVYSTDGGGLTLQIIGCESKNFGLAGKAIKEISFRLYGFYKPQEETQTQTSSIGSRSRTSRSQTERIPQQNNLESQVLKYLAQNPGSRLLDISEITESSDKARDILANLLEQEKIKFENGKYFQINKEIPKLIKEKQTLIQTNLKQDSSKKYTIVFASGRDDPYNKDDPNNAWTEIFTMLEDGSDIKKVTHINERLTNYTSYSNVYPCWSPDGTKIAFISARVDSHRIFITNPDGSGLKRIMNSSTSNLGRRLSWSPDRTKLLFDSEKGKVVRMGVGKLWDTKVEKDIYTLDINNSKLKRLTHHPAPDYHPSWSPKGDKIIFSSERSEKYTYIYTMDPDGSNIRNLGISGYYPSFSPDGTKVAYNVGGNICIANANGSNPKQITKNGMLSNFPFFWSPDGTKFIFSAIVPEYVNKYSDLEICIINSDGSGFRQLTNNKVCDKNPILCPTPTP